MIAFAGLIGFAAAFGPGDALKMKPLQTMNGGDSKSPVVMVRMIQSDSQWKELWAYHKGVNLKTAKDAPTPPPVDFAKDEVLAVFGGHMADVQSYEYVKTYDKDGTAVIQLAQNTIPPAKQAGTKHPYIIMVLPKEPVPVQVELDTVAKDGSHYWMQIASFRAPKA